jgi:ribosomal protein S18 acetylase RimI-like enzyme
VNDLLENPVFNALRTGDRHLGLGNERVKFFDEAVSPFAGFEANNEKGFQELHELLPPGRRILYAIPSFITIPGGWRSAHEIKGVQFIYEAATLSQHEFPGIVPLTSQHAEEMVQLAKLTKPGPFATRTIEFGSYYGIFEKEKLVAMTGQRLHVDHYTEISAVCTHPDHLGKGYARHLLRHQLAIILRQGQRPFLHVREDNERAIAIYQQLGFRVSRPMIFYFLKKE